MFRTGVLLACTVAGQRDGSTAKQKAIFTETLKVEELPLLDRKFRCASANCF